ncbi:ester cyclase [Serratia proteamaculans]|uniref:ester cyclase n=1 Tax=Serratia proteamaculans TaxID=28151 RepID=UPI0014327602|nr:nuclear transport factor 2 family protein [Serratia proteamaculans]
MKHKMVILSSSILTALSLLCSAPSLASTGSMSSAESAYTFPSAPSLKAHNYTQNEIKTLKHSAAFHRNFSSHVFSANAPLVAEDLKWYKNGEHIEGREAFVKGISSFVAIFPDVTISDIFTTVDGNTATVRYVITGTQRNDFNSPWGMIKATNKVVHIDGIEIMTFNSHGKLQELTTIEDLDQIRAQLIGE